MRWVDKHIEIEPPKKPKKLTGTRFAAILGENKWSTPFKTWCAITRTYEEPFTDTVYTIAGKIIEPKQAAYMKRAYAMFDLKTPTDIYGEDYFKYTFGDFFPDHKIFGGMWDYILVENGNPYAVLEMKTTKRSEDWQNDIPEYYAKQAALYAYLLGVEDVYMVCTVLDDADYQHPEAFECNIRNTFVRNFKLHERYPKFEYIVAEAERWWINHVESGISPDFDEKFDADTLTVLRTVHPDTAPNLAEIESLKAEIDKAKADIADTEKRYKTLTDALKEVQVEALADPNVDKVVMNGSQYIWTVSKTVGTELDIDKLKADGIYDKYLKPKTTYTLRCAKNRESEHNV